MRKYGDQLAQDKGSWIDKHVWHGKAHTWKKITWLISEVCASSSLSGTRSTLTYGTLFAVQWKRISGGRPFLIKGIQCAADARKALEVGCEGIVVTNHAGRQVDGAVASLDALPEIVDAVGDSKYFVSCLLL